MPEITRFNGVVVRIYSLGKEHNPPHIHFIYGEMMAAYDIDTLLLIEGNLPLKIAKMCVEWLTLYQNELLKMWNTQTFRKLPPL